MTVLDLSSPRAPVTGTTRDGAHDFDFLLGSWRVRNRRLRRPLSGSGEWEEFEGKSIVRPLWGGRANYEEWEADAPGGSMRAVSLHLYDPAAGEWSLHWATRESGRLGVPTVGHFTGARGEFHDQERHDGRAIFIRITWEPRGDHACRFEQAYSADGGRTWETNWLMDFTRDGPSPDRAVADCSHEGNRDFDFLLGDWRVHNRRLRAPLSGSREWYEFDARSTEHPLWEGAGNLEEVEGALPDGTPLRGLALRLFDPLSRQWSIHWASSTRGRLDPPISGTFANGLGVFYGYEPFEERMIFLRFHWIRIDGDRARWEQAFSNDGGATWETNWVMEFTRAADRSLHGGVVELRRYLLHPGVREALITLFEREFMEPQERAGMQLIAQYRDLDESNTFTWLRGFPDMAARASALTTFYDGPVWARHRDAANATMVSSDDVRLLHPVPLTTAVEARGARLVVATIYTLTSDAASGFAAHFERAILPRLEANGMRPFALFETEQSVNTFPRLPVREHEHAFVWLAQYDDPATYERCAAALEADPRWPERRAALDRQLAAPPLVWRLAPTARSPERW